MNVMNAINNKLKGNISVIKKYHTRTANILHHVPGASGKYPIRKTVAIQLETMLNGEL